MASTGNKRNGQGAHGTALTAAAAALDAELKRYAELAAEAMSAPLTSEKSVDRAGRAVHEAAESEKRVLEHVQALVRAVSSARETQEATSASLRERAGVIAQKRGELDTLLARLAKLGEAAKMLNESVLKVSGYKPSPYATDGSNELREALGQIDANMATCVKLAEDLAKDAAASDLADLGRQADGLRQQILSAKNRLSHLNKSLAS